MAVMRVVTPGLSSTLQDGGRRSGIESGIPPGGAADDLAYRLNCLLLGNDTRAAVVEQVLVGGSFEVLEPVVVAFTGADMAPSVNGAPVPLANRLGLKPGDLLQTRAARRGCFGYLGVVGGFAADRVFGSASTNVEGQLGGFGGRRLAAGDRLDNAVGVPSQGYDGTVEGGRATRLVAAKVHEELCAPPRQLRFTRGPQDEYFDEAGYLLFTTREYRVSPRSNRVGYRIEGDCPSPRAVPRTPDTGSGPTDIVEEGNPVGGIQVAGGKEIICLGRDCGTSGAYAKIGCLIGTDVSRMAQLAPGDSFRFTEVTPAQARAIRSHARQLLAAASADSERTGGSS